MSFAQAELRGSPVIVCRTGYTGEQGFELLVPAGQALALWDALVAAMEPFGGCRAVSVRATRCARRWATHCTGTS